MLKSITDALDLLNNTIVEPIKYEVREFPNPQDDGDTWVEVLVTSPRAERTSFIAGSEEVIRIALECMALHGSLLVSWRGEVKANA